MYPLASPEVKPARTSRFSKSIHLIFRIFFRLLYHEFAWSYDWVAAIVSLGHWQEWVLAVLPHLDGQPVLELGHGPGHLQAALARKQISTFGLDSSRQMQVVVSRRIRKAGKSCLLVRSAAQHLPFESGRFSRVVATFPSEYILDPDTLQEIWRILKPGGRLVILPFAWITGDGLLERAAAWLFRVTRQTISILPPVHASPDKTFLLEDPFELDPWFRYFSDPARRLGFTIRGEHISLKKSALVLVFAEKPAINFDQNPENVANI